MKRDARGDKRIRVGVVIDGYEAYGVLMFTRRLLEHLDRERFMPVGIFLSPGPAKQAVRDLCEEVVDLRTGSLYPMAREGRSKYNVPNILRKIRAVVRGTWGIARAIRKHRIDVVHVSLWPDQLIAGAASYLRRTPCLWHIHGPYAFTGPADAIARFGYRKFADALIPCSRFVEDSLPPEGRDKSVVVHNGVDARDIAENQRHGEFRRRLGIGPDVPLVALFGAISPRKGHEVFFRAAGRVVRRFPDTVFALAGNESKAMKRRWNLTDRLKSLAEELGIAEQVLFAGMVQDAPYYMGDCDVICMPTIPIGKNTGEAGALVLLEAMAAGTAFIGGTNGWPPEAIDDRVDGLLCPPSDPDALADAIEYLLEDDDRRERIAAAGQRKVAENFDIARTCRGIEAQYERFARGDG